MRRSLSRAIAIGCVVVSATQVAGVNVRADATSSAGNARVSGTPTVGGGVKAWATSRTRVAHGGSVVVTATSGSSASFVVNGPTIAMWFVSGPRNGKAAVLVNGRRVKTVDQFATRVSRRSVQVRGRSGRNVVKIVALAEKNPRSTGVRVNVDAFSARLGSCSARCVKSPRIVSQTSPADGDAAWYPDSVPERGSSSWNVAIGSYVRGQDVSPIDNALPVIEKAACDQARRVDRGVVVLSFGRQVSGGASGFGRSISRADIVSTAVAWSNGLAECGKGPWEVAVGTSNSGAVTAYNGLLGGREWADIVVSARTAADPRVSVVGAVDIEPSWGPPGQARAWVDGFVARTKVRLWNFGSADGCPQSVSSDLTCNNGWTIDDVLWVSSHAGPNVIVMPQVHTYGGAQSRQWSVLAARALQMGMPLRIGAITVQTAACAQIRGGCPTTGISAWDGWAQMRRYVDQIPSIAGMPIGAPMDIRWGWGSAFVIPPPTSTSSTTTTVPATSTTVASTSTTIGS